MAKKDIVGIPAEIAAAGTETLASGSMLALQTGANFAQRLRPGYVSPRIQRAQSILESFEHNSRRRSGAGVLAVAGLMRPGLSQAEIEAYALSATDEMTGIIKRDAEEDGVGKKPIIEVRPVISEASLFDTDINTKRETIVPKVGEILLEEHGVLATYSTHPIMPTRGDDSPINTTSAWGTIANELDGLRSFDAIDEDESDSENLRPLGMLAIVDPEYLKGVFDKQLPSDSTTILSDDGILFLDRVSNVPSKNFIGRRGSDKGSVDLPVVEQGRRREDEPPQPPDRSGLLVRAINYPIHV